MFKTDLQKYIHLSKYARWIEKENRRETWEETVDRLINFWKEQSIGGKGINDAMVDDKILDEIREKVYKGDIVPSMRTLMTAGKSLKYCNMVGFNCAAIAVNHPRVFDEHFYILMCGTGVGFSVEREYINKLPEVAEEFFTTDTTIVVQDSRAGWAKALKELISFLYNGDVPNWDVSRVRPAGARLKTMGGRASGPVPLEILFKFCINIFKKAAGRKLNSAECHRLMCKIAETVIVGSVRRSACISFGNLSDDRHRRLKTGEFWIHYPELKLANNSVMYTEKPDMESFTKEFRNLYKSRAGERGIVNQEALKEKAESCGREHDGQYLLNPCAETILRDNGGLCNLSEVIIRPNDTLAILKKKVKYATILGTLQSTLTKFKYVRKIWQSNAEEERLLGVSFTGILDHSVMGSLKCKEWLIELKKVAYQTNKKWAKKLGINESKQITLVKPSGTTSLLWGTSSGIHPRYSDFYIRRVTQDVKDPLTNFMKKIDIPYTLAGDKVLFAFPIMAPPESNISIDTRGQLDLWALYREYWCDGNPSCSIYYNDDTYLMLQDWIWKNWDSVGGLSFFPNDDNVYENAPLEKITEKEYYFLKENFPKNINWDDLSKFEKEDSTTCTQELSCSGGQCDLL